MAIVFVGIDLAKNVFALHGVDEAGRAVRSRTAARPSSAFTSGTLQRPWNEQVRLCICGASSNTSLSLWCPTFDRPKEFGLSRQTDANTEL